MATGKSQARAALSKKFVRFVENHPDDYPDAKAFLDSLNQWPQKAVRANTYASSIEDLFNQWGIELDRIPWCGDASYFDYDRKVGSSKEHENGFCYVGDPSAMISVEVSTIKSSDFVVDMCGAPGGKAIHALNFLGKGGTLIANDVDPRRVKILRENIDRIMRAIPDQHRPRIEVTNFSAQELSDIYANEADVVILDAPCSGEAMMRRSNVARRQWSEKLIKKMSMLQKMLLAHAAVISKSGGQIVFSTCTFNSVENEEVSKFGIEEVGLRAVSGVEILEKLTRKNNGGFIPAIERDFGLALYPHLVRGDGQVVSVLIK